MTVTPHEARLHIGNGRDKLPVRCEGYVENGEFHAEAIWIIAPAKFADGKSRLGVCNQSFDIIESLRAEVIEALEAEATDALVWETTP